MGDDFIDKQNRNYKRQRERVLNEERKQLCLSDIGKEVHSSVFNFSSSEGLIPVGAPVILADVPGETFVRVMKGVEYVGELDRVGSEKIRKLFSEHNCLGGFINATVNQPPDLAGYHQIKVEFKDA